VTTTTTDPSDDRVDVALLDALLQLSPDAAIAVDHRGEIVAANELAAELFAAPVGSLVGSPVEQLLPERFRAAHARERGAFARAPTARRMGTGLDLWGRRADGSEFPVDVSLAPVAGPGGPVIVAAVRDMTERRREQAAQAQLAAIVESTDDAIVATSCDGTIVSWNQGATRLLGYEPAEIVGQAVAVLVAPDLRVDLETARQRVMAGERVSVYETTRRSRGGVDVDVEVTLSAVRERGATVTGVVAVLRDITDRVRARAERVAAQRQRQELAVVADRERIARDLHDVVIQRLFAAGITLQSTAQRLAGDVPDVAERLGRVVDELDATITEVRSTIFSLEKTNAGATGLRARVVDLAEAAAGTVGHQPVLHFAGPVDVAVPDDVVDDVLAVLTEALSNVARHARARTSCVEVEVGDGDGDGAELVVSVVDDGIGIADVERRSGVRTLRRRAEARGGSFALTTPPGGGTRLVWRVPLR
jgi:PAS domain S-box-containing protein